MFKNYFKIAWRSLWKNKLISFINIFGLTSSITICLLISLFINDELNYDNFQPNYKSIYRLETVFTTPQGDTKHWAATPPPLKDFLETKFPEVTEATRISKSSRTSIVADEKKFKEENCFLADPSVFSVLGLTLLKGNAVTALSDPHSVVLTESLAEKIFGAPASALEHTISINNYPLKVTGILKDLPANSHLQIGLLRSMNILNETQKDIMGDWHYNDFYTYARLKPGTKIDLFTNKIENTMVSEGISMKKGSFLLALHQLSQLHLDGNIEKELNQNSSWTFIYIFISIGFLILLLASINYINLSTSRSFNRSKEIGVRKTLGAFKKNLVAQFLSESIFITLLSFGLAILIVFTSLPYFNAITGKTLSLIALFNPFLASVSFGIIIFIGILAGIYPAFVISSFEPINALKGNSIQKKPSVFSFGLRKSLVVFQFVISAFLVISSLVVIDQISYMFNKSLGYQPENIMVIKAHPSYAQLKQFKNSLRNNKDILEISATSAVPGKRVMIKLAMFEGVQNDGVSRMMYVDHNYFKTMGMEMIAGRDFDASVSSDTTESVIINQAMVKQNNWTDALGKRVDMIFGTTPQQGKPKHGKIIGVVKDFHQGSLHTNIEPMVFTIDPFNEQIVIKYNEDGIDKIKQDLNTSWNNAFPNEVFTFSFLQDDLKTLYKPETTLKQLLILFTSFAIIIATLGLFGLIYFSNTLKKKEISIRKVLGASNKNLVQILSKEYIVLIVLSLVISIPLANYALTKWLTNFAYRVDISIGTFIIGISVTLLIAFATIVLQGLKAAVANPVNNIKSE